MKVVRTNGMAWDTGIEHGRFLQRRKHLGGDKLSCGLWELPPGKRSFPFHFHHVTEEALFVVSGHAKVRTPDGETEIGPGDYVSFPPGGPAHQLINEGTEPLVYLGLSAGQGVDIVEYPDSGKVACAIKGGSPKRWVWRDKDQAGYFDGED
jgi:uncharacterized cupin superfamily protein